MYLNYAINKFMQDVQGKSDFDYLIFPDVNRYYFYDPSLTFENRLYKRLALFKYDNLENPYICAMWNRSPLNPIPEQPRQMRANIINTSTGLADSYMVKNVQCQINICFISNDPDYLTSFEEFFIMGYDRSITLNSTYKIPVNYQEIGDITEINKSSKTFKVAGVKDFLEIGNQIFITNSTDNDGDYTVSNLTFSTDSTIIEISEDIVSDTVDGVLIKRDGIYEAEASIYYSGIEFNEINKIDTDSRGELMFLVMSMNVQYPVISHKEGAKIIKHIDFKVKGHYSPNTVTSSDMIQPYDEIVIE